MVANFICFTITCVVKYSLFIIYYNLFQKQKILFCLCKKLHMTICSTSFFSILFMWELYMKSVKLVERIFSVWSQYFEYDGYLPHLYGVDYSQHQLVDSTILALFSEKSSTQNFANCQFWHNIFSIHCMNLAFFHNKKVYYTEKVISFLQSLRINNENYFIFDTDTTIVTRQ